MKRQIAQLTSHQRRARAIDRLERQLHTWYAMQRLLAREVRKLERRYVKLTDGFVRVP